MKDRSNMIIGERIKEVFMTMPKTCTVEWFSKELNCDRRNIYRIFQKDNIDIELLGRISQALNHDFFKDLSDSLEKNTSNGVLDTSYDKEMKIYPIDNKA